MFYVGVSHPADIVKIGRKKRVLAELRGETAFEEMLPPGRTRLSFCSHDGECERYGTINIPALELPESLFVNIRQGKPRVQRRGP